MIWDFDFVRKKESIEINHQNFLTEKTISSVCLGISILCIIHLSDLMIKKYSPQL